MKMKLVAPPLYVLTTQTLDKAKGVEVGGTYRDCWALHLLSSVINGGLIQRLLGPAFVKFSNQRQKARAYNLPPLPCYSTVLCPCLPLTVRLLPVYVPPAPPVLTAVYGVCF